MDFTQSVILQNVKDALTTVIVTLEVNALLVLKIIIYTMVTVSLSVLLDNTDIMELVNHVNQNVKNVMHMIDVLFVRMASNKITMANVYQFADQDKQF